MKGAKDVALQVLGWVLLLVGVAAIPLPGPGLLLMFAGLAVLSQQYEWAERRLAPVKYRALKGAADSVESWPRIVFSTLVAIGLVACGVLWIQSPPVPQWWPEFWIVDEGWWLPGGIWTGITQIGSGIVAVGLLVWSYQRYHDNPDAVRRLEDEWTQRA